VANKRQPERVRAATNVDNARIFRDLTLLFYPSVLGSIIYHLFEVISGTESITSSQLMCTLLLASIICHYSVDYLYTLYFENYNFVSFCLDLIIVGLMFYAASSINFSQGSADTKSIVLAFAATYGLFLAIDFITLDLSPECLKIILPEAALAIYFLTVGLTQVKLTVPTLTCSILVAAAILFYIAPKPTKRRVTRKA
jgi:hypothetical protein